MSSSLVRMTACRAGTGGGRKASVIQSSRLCASSCRPASSSLTVNCGLKRNLSPAVELSSSTIGPDGKSAAHTIQAELILVIKSYIVPYTLMVMVAGPGRVHRRVEGPNPPSLGMPASPNRKYSFHPDLPYDHLLLCISYACVAFFALLQVSFPLLMGKKRQTAASPAAEAAPSPPALAAQGTKKVRMQ